MAEMSWNEAGNSAVITGGASGIGFAAAKAFVQNGMNVLLADLDDQALSQAEAELRAMADGPVRVIAKSCDVSKMADMEALRDTAISEFGAVSCLMNNAGTGFPVGAPWENLEEWKRLSDINLWGIIHGCQAFIPLMLKAKSSAVVINTGSKQGITLPPGNYGYNLSKAGVLAYTECLAHALRQIDGCKISAHLLVPGFTYTGLTKRRIPEKPAAAWDPEQVVAFMLEKLGNGDFYILCPDNDVTREMDEKRIQWNTDDIIENRPALSRWHPDFEEAFAEYMKS